MPSLEEKYAPARGFSVVLDACAEALLCEPTDQVLSDVCLTAQVMGFNELSDVVSSGELTQRYYDRFFVASSPLYVPLCESCISRGGIDQAGVMQYAAVEGSCVDHLSQCYAAVGFDYRSLTGFDLAVANLRADSLATELAFLAYCKKREADAGEAGDEAQSLHWAELAQRFAREHTSVWIEKAANCLAATSDDFYARVCRLAACLIRMMREKKAL